jgi:hypothetical protein
VLGISILVPVTYILCRGEACRPKPPEVGSEKAMKQEEKAATRRAKQNPL